MTVATRGGQAYILLPYVCGLLGRQGDEDKVTAEFHFVAPINLPEAEAPFCLMEDALVAIMFSVREPAMLITLWHGNPEVQSRWKLRDLLEAHDFVVTSQPATSIIRQRLVSINKLKPSQPQPKMTAPKPSIDHNPHAIAVLCALNLGIEVTYNEGRFSFPLA